MADIKNIVVPFLIDPIYLLQYLSNYEMLKHRVQFIIFLLPFTCIHYIKIKLNAPCLYQWHCISTVHVCICMTWIDGYWIENTETNFYHLYRLKKNYNIIILTFKYGRYLMLIHEMVSSGIELYITSYILLVNCSTKRS